MKALNCRLASSHLAASAFPAATKGHPEREQDETHVESEALTTHVDAVVLELVAARQVPRSVDLRDAREAGTHSMTLQVAWDVFHLFMSPVAGRLDFARPQRARSDEAHIAAQDVPELRQLIQGGGAWQAAQRPAAQAPSY